MNTSTVISFQVAADLSAYENVAVKLTSTGINLASPGDRVIGTMIRANNAPSNGQSAVGMAADVFLSAGNGLHFVVLGGAGAVALGDDLEQWPSGRVAPLGGTITGTASDTGDTINITNHGFSNGQQLIFTTLTGGTGLTAALAYFVISSTANTFQVSLTSGGAAVAVTADYSAVAVRPAYAGPSIGQATQSVPAGNVGAQFRAIIYTAARAGGVEVLQAARTLTAADSGKTFILALAGGFTVTLPSNLTAGFNCRFFVKVAPTTAYIIAAATADTMAGFVLSSSGGAEDTESAFTGDQLNFVANTAVIGDRADIFIDGQGVYAKGECAAAGGITITG